LRQIVKKLFTCPGCGSIFGYELTQRAGLAGFCALRAKVILAATKVTTMGVLHNFKNMATNATQIIFTREIIAFKRAIIETLADSVHGLIQKTSCI
jgi:hypothetical protein